MNRELKTRSPITDYRSPRRHDGTGAFSAGALVVAFCLILLWHDPLVFWNDDYELSILPVFADMARSWSEGHWPILSPYSWVCGNLAGEFQYGVFSVFVNAVVIVIWKFPLTFSQQAAAVSIAHLFALAVGAFLLARDRQFSLPLSIFVALIASLNGWIMCWGATDWFGALGAFTWLPWAWWGAARAARSTAKQMEIPLACAVCLPRRYWRISLHGFDAVPFDHMAGNQGISGSSEHFVDCADAFWCGTRLRLIRSRVARDP